MGIGGCIGVFALGAILTFGVNWHVHGMNITVVGVILMAAGLLGVVTIAGMYRRRRPMGMGVGEGEEIVRERRYYE
jgi:Flp pilus assembly protein TadB